MLPLINNGTVLLPNGNMGTTQIGGNDVQIGSHLTMTGDPAGGIMKAHDTFQVGSQSINLSGGHYNGLNGGGNTFDPPANAGVGMRNLFP